METTQTLEVSTNEMQSTTIDEQTAYNFATDQIIHQHRTSEDVADMLVQKGMERNAAYNVVDSIYEQINDAKRQRAKKDMLYGGLWFFGGLIVTIVTYSSASGGGRYVVAWGAIIFGGIQFFRGLSNNV